METPAAANNPSATQMQAPARTTPRQAKRALSEGGTRDSPRKRRGPTNPAPGPAPARQAPSLEQLQEAARARFAAKDFPAAARLYGAAATRSPAKAASQEKAHEAAAWLSAGVKEPARRDAHARAALDATRAALRLDPANLSGARVRLGLHTIG